ncbi:MAG: Crp/Fnr family transcriptional regulator [bacterium]
MEDELFKRFGRLFTKGTVLFREGDTGDEMYIIDTGKVKIFKVINGVEKVLAILGQSDFLGEMSLLNKKPRSANAQVIEDSRLLVINNNTFEAMIRNNPEIAIRIMKILARRLDDANIQIANLMIKDSTQRLIATLIRMSEAEHKVDNSAFLKTDAERLSVITGLEKDTVDELINTLVKRRLIEIANDGILIKNTDNLKRYLDYIMIKEQFEKSNER